MAEYNESKRESLLFLWEIIKVVVISLAIIVPIRFFVVQPFFVRGASMEPNFQNGDYLIIDEITYRFNEPKRGEVIVFRFPQDPKQFFIKRIIGLPGETIELNKKNVIIRNADNPSGFILDESDYLFQPITLGSLRMKLDDNEYFVMGDNRLQSSDSRRWGPVNVSLIVGRSVLRAFPFGRFGTFGEVQY